MGWDVCAILPYDRTTKSIYHSHCSGHFEPSKTWHWNDQRKGDPGTQGTGKQFKAFHHHHGNQRAGQLFFVNFAGWTNLFRYGNGQPPWFIAQIQHFHPRFERQKLDDSEK